MKQEHRHEANSSYRKKY